MTHRGTSVPRCPTHPAHPASEVRSKLSAQVYESGPACADSTKENVSRSQRCDVTRQGPEIPPNPLLAG